MNGNVVLMEKFNNPELDKDLKWFSPPDKWEVNSESSKLIIKTNKQTDFWQKTHYGVPPHAHQAKFKQYFKNEKTLCLS
ncbi:MAG: hypothetical protein ACQEWV_13490 [Bacillota bacterium]